MAQDYYCILTNAGLAYEAACKANQVPIKLTHFAVGDGNGAAYNPGPEATALRRETHRQAINSLIQDTANPSWLLAEAMIADDVGGWTIREVGIFTDTGILYAIGKYPDSVKPVLAQGSGKQFYVRAIFQTSNATSVTLLIDNSIVMASRAFVLEHVQAELAKRDAKNSVMYTTTAAIALNGLDVQSGGDWPSALPAGARILPRHQPDAKDNGIYIAAAGAWTRATDADVSLEVTPGLLIPVEQGTVHADSLWQLVTDGPITLGTTALQFEMAAGRTGVGAATYRSVTVDSRGRVTGGSNPATVEAAGLADDLASPLLALPFPTIASADNRMAVNGSTVAGTGGAVSVAADVLIMLGSEVVAGKTGRMRTFTTQAWTSANLDINSTYFLRAQVSGGALSFYVQKGDDADTVPASLKGTPGNANGGGFDSTPIDMLVAKVVTGAAGSMPTVTALANAALLRVQSVSYDSVTRTTLLFTLVAKRPTDLVLNWARRPTFYTARFDYSINGNLTSPEDMRTYYSGSVSDTTGTLTAAVSRYVFAPVAQMDANATGNSAVTINPLTTDFLVMA